MNEPLGRQREPRDGSATDGPRAESPKTPVKPMLTRLIAGYLQKRWAQDEPGEKCFDHDDSTMARLLDFIDGTVTDADRREVRTHLLQCPRCRFIYAKIREGGEEICSPKDRARAEVVLADRESIPSLLRDNLRSAGPVVFPGEEVTEGAWEFGLLSEMTDELAERISESVAERGWRLIRGVLPRRGVVVICFGNPVHRCGKRMAAKMVDAGIDDVHVVMADDFFSPKLWCDPRELKNRHVFVFVDVVHSGGLLNRLFEVCRQGQPYALVGMAIVDQSDGTICDERLYGLWREHKEKREQHGNQAIKGVRFFDPVAGRAWHRGNLPAEVSDPEKAKDTIESRLREIRPFARYIEATGALKQDAWIGNVCYPWAIDLLCLLRNDEARGELAQRAAERLADLSGSEPWCIVFPAERHRRAGAWARLLAETLRWPIVKVGLKNRRHYRPLTGQQREELAKCPRALIVDAAIRSGKTLQSLVGVLRSERRIALKGLTALYAFDGLFDEPRKKLEGSLDVQIRSLFRLPLGAPTEPVGQYCRNRLRETFEELDRVKRQDDSVWVDVVRGYCQKKLELTGKPFRERTTENVEISLRQALEEGERGAPARLEQSCDPPRPSLVKHLDVAYALQEPRTKAVLHGFMCNSMPLDFIESCALALATQKDYDWFDRDWLVLHKRILTNPTSQRWTFLVYITYWARRHGTPEQVQRIRTTVESFKCSQAPATIPLFPDLEAGDEHDDALRSRCETILSVLS